MTNKPGAPRSLADLFESRSLQMKERHGWKARPGCAICVLDRGKVRFDYPEGWDLTPEEDAFRIRDVPAPNDNCVLAISYGQILEKDEDGTPINWAEEMPLRELVANVVANDSRDVRERGEMHERTRPGIEVAWQELTHFDPHEKRMALSRVALARAAPLQAMITYDFWQDEREQRERPWEDMLESLVLGQEITDPTRGPVVN